MRSCLASATLGTDEVARRFESDFLAAAGFGWLLGFQSSDDDGETDADDEVRSNDESE